MKTQVSVEYMIIVGISLLIFLTFFYFYYVQFLANEDLMRVSLAQNSLRKIVEVANELREGNYPSLEVIAINLPEGIEEASIFENTLLYKIRLRGGSTYATREVPFKISGNLPTNSGENLVTIKMNEDKSIEIIPGLPIPFLIVPFSYKKVLERGKDYILNFTFKNMLYKDLENVSLSISGDISSYSCIGEIFVETDYSDGIFINAPQHYGNLKYNSGEIDGNYYYFVVLDSDGDGKYDKVLVDKDENLSDANSLIVGSEFTVTNTYRVFEIDDSGAYVRFCLVKANIPSSSSFNFTLAIHMPASAEFKDYIGILSATYENLSTKSLLSFPMPKPDMRIEIKTFCDENYTTRCYVFNPLDKVYFKIEVFGNEKPLASVLGIFLVDSNSKIVNSLRNVVLINGSYNGSFQIPMSYEDGYWVIQAIDVGSGFINQSTFYLDALRDTIIISTYKDENYTLLCDIFQPGDVVYYKIEIKNPYGAYIARIVNFSVLDPSLNLQEGSFENKLISTPYYSNFSLNTNVEEGDWTLRVSYKFVSQNITIRVSKATSTPGSIYWDTLLYPFTVKYGSFFLPSLNCQKNSVLRATLKIVDQDGKGVEGVFQTGSTDACIVVMDEDGNTIVKCGIATDLGGGYYRYDFSCSQGVAGKSYVLHAIITQHAIPGAGISIVKVKNSRTFNII